MTDDDLHQIAAVIGEVLEQRLADVATKADVAAIRADMATKADMARIDSRFDRLEVKVNERFDELDARVTHLEQHAS